MQYKCGECEDLMGEYLLALRLANKLADLRATNANPYSNALRLSTSNVGIGQK